MLKLEPGNVLLKPSHRRQLLSALRRSLQLGERLGNFVLTITMRRVGRLYELRASCSAPSCGFDLRARRHDWQTALRELARSIHNRLHARHLGQPALA